MTIYFKNKAVIDYAMKHYVTEHCTLCGNRGVIDTRGVSTPAGLVVGRLNYCICPNGQAMRSYKAAMEPAVTDTLTL